MSIRKKIDSEFFYLYGTCSDSLVATEVNRRMEIQGFKTKILPHNNKPAVWIRAKLHNGRYTPILG